MMFVFISGAARSGKSTWAEKYALSLSHAEQMDTPRVYLATARILDQEMKERVLRHQATRQEKGFETWEQDVDISRILPRLVQCVPAATLLLECLGTLLANEMFGRETTIKTRKTRKTIASRGREKANVLVEKIYGEILSLKANTANLLVVSNDVFMDGSTYDEETENYRRALGALHVKLARESQLAVECVCGQATTIYRKTPA
ncbi:MAG: bifunctional adenosylcobinamide kinase/adenosylcobinamide-phosphate guanylyltransferase [Synergistaceae bacterium]|jgi:adenosylcobinamide kinase/adenosylcobinamide-phosphate guanylyltransferase|nr:bifunctional adenosylcobinamide kinase/adenosylcobinamide-phosphate guanylyltransferase [Synergistaceae bacterium]